MSRFYVLLLVPDYAAVTFGHDNYLAEIEARTVEAAISRARCDACAFLGGDVDQEDFHCLLAVHGACTVAYRGA